LIVNFHTKEIICVALAQGKKHDFKLFGESVGCAIADHIKALLDSGYQGILKFHKNSETPKKKSKGKKLTPEEKAKNTRQSRQSRLRILVENIIAKVKVFKITSTKYRNRRKRFGLRMALICGIINYENREWG